MADLPFVIVRKKATQEMVNAGARARHSAACDGGYSLVGTLNAEAAYPAMISSSPPPVSLEEIVEVLKALAGPLEGNWDCQPDDTKIIMGPHRYDLRLGISLGDLRRARSLLSRLASMEAKP